MEECFRQTRVACAKLRGSQPTYQQPGFKRLTAPTGRKERGKPNKKHPVPPSPDRKKEKPKKEKEAASEKLNPIERGI